MPSKILGMMASGKPSVITGNKDSEVAKNFKENIRSLDFKKFIFQSINHL